MTEEHGAKSEQPDIAVAKEEAHTVKRIEGCEHGQILRDMPCPADGEHDEPDKRDRAEKSGDPCRAPRLYREQGEQDEDGQRNHKTVESRSYHLKPFYSRQHR